jgi:hypothetical protein
VPVSATNTLEDVLGADAAARAVAQELVHSS